MEKFVPVEKMSKKDRRAYFAARRGTWGGIRPVTRRAERPGAYDRKKVRREERFFGAEPFLFCLFCRGAAD